MNKTFQQILTVNATLIILFIVLEYFAWTQSSITSYGSNPTSVTSWVTNGFYWLIFYGYTTTIQHSPAGSESLLVGQWNYGLVFLIVAGAYNLRIIHRMTKTQTSTGNTQKM